MRPLLRGDMAILLRGDSCVRDRETERRRDKKTKESLYEICAATWPRPGGILVQGFRAPLTLDSLTLAQFRDLREQLADELALVLERRDLGLLCLQGGVQHADVAP